MIDEAAVVAGLKGLAQTHAVTLAKYGTRQAQILEIAGLLTATQHYRDRYAIEPRNLESGGVFSAKLTTSRYPRRYSYFSVRDRATNDELYEIFGNVPVLDPYPNVVGSYVVDVAVAKAGTVIERKGWPGLARRDLVTFAEIKNLVVYPMLLAQFIGIVHELAPEFLNRRVPWGFAKAGHFMPALMTVGYLHATAKSIAASYSSKGYRVKICPNLDSYVARGGWNKSISPLL